MSKSSSIKLNFLPSKKEGHEEIKGMTEVPDGNGAMIHAMTKAVSLTAVQSTCH